MSTTGRTLTLSLALCNVLVYILASMGHAEQILATYAFHPQQLDAATGYTFLTAGFVHLSFPHLFWNTLFLVVFGRIVDDLYDTTWLATLYITGILAGNLIVTIAQIPGSFAGGSGGVYALLTAAMFREPMRPVHEKVFVPVAVIGAFYILPAVAYIQTLEGGVSHSSHVAGAIVGFTAAIMTDRSHLKEATIVTAAIMALMLAIGV